MNKDKRAETRRLTQLKDALIDACWQYVEERPCRLRVRGATCAILYAAAFVKATAETQIGTIVDEQLLDILGNTEKTARDKMLAALAEAAEGDKK